MRLFGFFDRKGTPVDRETLLKRFTCEKRDWEGLEHDEGDHLCRVYCHRKTMVTMRGKTISTQLVPCNSSADELRADVKSGQTKAYYVSSQPFSAEFSLSDGKWVKLRGCFKSEFSQDFSSWVQTEITEPGKNYMAKDVAGILDRSFSSREKLAELLDLESYEESEPLTPPPEEDLKVGATVFGRYRIESELGAGGMGCVFLAADEKTGISARKKVVLKALLDNLCDDEQARGLIRREANTLIKLHHDAIAACYDCEFLGNKPVLEMEYVEGLSLDEYLKKRGGKLNEADTRVILKPIAEALDYAHKKNIYHLDVKPQNIMVRENPKDAGSRSCLLDFGIARHGRTDDYAGMTTVGISGGGTRPYMSVEQRSGESPCAEMDVFALAVTAYQCLTGRLPFDNGKRLKDPPDPIQSGTPFASAVMKGLSYSAEDRQKTCVELINPPKPIKPLIVTPPVEKGPGKPAAGETIVIKKPPAKVSSAEPSRLDAFAELQKSFLVYRQLLTQSAQKCESGDPELAKWLRSGQAMLRDLTRDLSTANADALVKFFVEVNNRRGGVSAEGFFTATDRLVELRAGLPPNGGRVWQAIKNSIGK